MTGKKKTYFIAQDAMKGAVDLALKKLFIPSSVKVKHEKKKVGKIPRTITLRFCNLCKARIITNLCSYGCKFDDCGDREKVIVGKYALVAESVRNLEDRGG